VSRLRTSAAIFAAAALLSACTHVQPLVVASHMSNPLDGGRSDTTSDFIGAGITATFGGVSIDAALGRKAINCAVFDSCPSTAGGLATVRWNPRGPR
jgi:hypothetical protein